MRRALEHARRGLGRTTPNPVVGACVVSDEGVVRRPGRARARRRAARRGARARRSRRGGARRHAVLHARAVRAHRPDRAVHRAHHRRRHPPRRRGDGGSVSAGAADAASPRCARTASRWTSASSATRRVRLNQPFLTAVREGRPFVILKAATSLDGRIAAAPGERTAADLGRRAAPRAVHAGAGRRDRASARRRCSSTIRC